MTSWPDRHPAGAPRDAAELLRSLTAAVGAVAQAQTPSDVFEGACRALAEFGIIAAVFGERGNGLAPLAHRLGDVTLPRPLPRSLLAPPGKARFFAAGRHPLYTLPVLKTLPAVPALDVALSGGERHTNVTVCLLTAGLDESHLPAAEAFGALLGATGMRAEVEGRLREANTRLEQRVRSRTEELASLFGLSSALGTAATEGEAAALATAAAARHLPGDAAITVMCADRRHTVVVSARGVIAPRFAEAALAQLEAAFAKASGSLHAACRSGPQERVEHPAARAGIALDGVPVSIAAVPVLTSAGVAGLIQLYSLRPAVLHNDQQRLLQTIALQLGNAAERLTGARSAERERLSALINGLTDGVVLIDRDGQVLAGNPAGDELLQAFEPAERDTVAELVHEALAACTTTGAELTAPGERTRHIAVRATPITDVTGEAAAAVTLHDATDENVIRERLFQSEKMVSVGQLVSGVAHELNNPLASISGFAQLLLARGLEGDPERYVTTIYEEAERASKIVQNLLSFARRRTPAKVEVDLNVLLQRVLELRDYDLRVHDIEVRRSFTEPLPACLADPHQIQQVLLNVITNAEHAIRSTGHGGVLSIATQAADGHVRVSIADTGAGIAEEHRRRLFDPFFTTKPVGDGTGLGLTISYGIIEEHGGRIEAANAPEGGAVFTIELPALQRAASERQELLEEPEPETTKRAILVVDDEPSIRELLAGLLLADGHQVETVRTGAEALNRLAERAFDAVITDIRMPELDGMLFYERVRERFPHLLGRVIFTSGDTVSPDTRAFIDTAGAPFISKPFKLREVRDLVRAITGYSA